MRVWGNQLSLETVLLIRDTHSFSHFIVTVNPPQLKKNINLVFLIKTNAVLNTGLIFFPHLLDSVNMRISAVPINLEVGIILKAESHTCPLTSSDCFNNVEVKQEQEN